MDFQAFKQAVIEEAKALAEHGIVFGEPKTDIDKIRTWK